MSEKQTVETSFAQVVVLAAFFVGLVIGILLGHAW